MALRAPRGLFPPSRSGTHHTSLRVWEHLASPRCDLGPARSIGSDLAHLTVTQRPWRTRPINGPWPVRREESLPNRETPGPEGEVSTGMRSPLQGPGGTLTISGGARGPLGRCGSRAMVCSGLPPTKTSAGSPPPMAGAQARRSILQSSGVRLRGVGG